jgi:uncharacterized hydrophobic protein (TIGR00271 family)
VRVLELRVYGEPDRMRGVAEALEQVTGTRRVSIVHTADGTGALVTVDLGPAAADRAIQLLEELGVPADDVVVVRLETIGAAARSDESVALVWADVLGQARTSARAPVRYLVLMAAAGVVGAFAIINRSPVLIVGAMAISPDLLPLTAMCTGVILRRPRLFGRGARTLVAGFLVTALVAAGVAAFLDLLSLLPDGFTLGAIPAAQTHVSASTIFVALAAGVAGMLAVETRGSSAVGVAISVTTIPAVAFFGVAIGSGEAHRAPEALLVLAVNVAMMLIGGSCALGVQRLLSTSHASASSSARNVDSPSAGSAA